MACISAHSATKSWAKACSNVRLLTVVSDGSLELTKPNLAKRPN